MTARPPNEVATATAVERAVIRSRSRTGAATATKIGVR